MPVLPVDRTLRQRHHGFSLLELLVVISIIAVATAGASLALRDNANATLEREGARLAALLEAGRAQSRASGVPVRWQSMAGGFRFEGLPENQLPSQWLSASTHVRGDDQLLLGPEPLIAPQGITLVNTEAPQSALRIATDGLRPFAVQTTTP
ncbi:MULTISPECIES: prepilin-type N-terminal cleavage/methylation domain-containing protein [Giesbergeria]|uniref:Prepilin-type N-terminal cleavage/methylation domain-containing protein n=1 Tax=Giesbergeria sinuosa TaxID=80883 RepID=A0ABV9Q906_9BURK